MEEEKKKAKAVPIVSEMGKTQKALLARGPIYVLRGTKVIKIYPDGKEEEVNQGKWL